MNAIEVHATSAMVIGPGQAVAAGIETLQSGGNAVDAAVATALAAGVVAPAQCGVAGFGGALITYLAAQKRVACLEFGAMSPAGVTPGWLLAAGEDAFPMGARAVMVPGTVAGLTRAVAAYGSRPLAQLVAPAVRLAREGFPASPGYVADLLAHRERIERFPHTAEWLLPDGQAPRLGSLITNEALARLLERLAAEGLDSLYRGEAAADLVAHVQASGGVLTLDDLADYTPRETEPLSLSFGAYTIHTSPLPTGGAVLAQAIKTLDGLDLARLWSEKLPYYHAVALALQSTWADQLTRLGDPTETAIALDRILSDEHTTRMRHRIEHLVHTASVLHGPEVIGLPGGTVHIAVADPEGNLAALTLTHGNPFGSGLSVPGGGTLVAGGMGYFERAPGRPNSVGPRKRPLYPACPTLVMKEECPLLLLGGIGGRKAASAVVQALLHYCALRHPVDDSLCLPRLHTDGSLTLCVDPGLPRPASDYLRAVGYLLESGEAGALFALMRDPDSGLFTGVVDPRATGLAVGI